MSDLKDLYQQVILDHNRNPRNFREIEGADRHAEGYNPLCGDRLTVWLKVDGDTIADVAFRGSGCAISKASASLMTSALKGKSVAEAREIFDLFHRMVTGEAGEGFDPEALGKLAVFSGVRDFPVRVKCASLAWHTLKAALSGSQEAVTTE
ncbi:MAG TPA: SUF system NifU family Fe-S cluster assembly protein [Candidatus Saccharimonadales bacterium]|nr:SUF system NifU family Fe-S cluster assembly protein [Candidatus Saccharimonadales bacterium]